MEEFSSAPVGLTTGGWGPTIRADGGGMRILQINTEGTWRGGERQTLYALEGLRVAGIDAQLLCRAGGPLHTRACALGIPCHAAANQAAALRMLARHGRRDQILHSQTAKGQSLAVMTKPWHRRPVVYTRRVNFVPRGAAARFKYRLTDHLVANNGPSAEIIRRFASVHVDVIPSAVKPRRLDRARAEELRLSLGAEDRRIVAMVGDLVPQKDPITLVRAAAQVLAQRSDILFLQFGRAQMRGAVEREIARQGLAEHFRLMGHHDDVEDYFAIFDLYVALAHPSEGFVSTVLDAFAYEVPVVATRTGGLVDSVADRGLLAAPGDVAGAADAILRLLGDDALRDQLIAKAAREVHELFSIPVVARRYIALYEQILRGDA